VPNTQTNAVLAALDDLTSLRPFPTVATRLLQLSDADADLTELAGIIECDPAVSLHLLRVANSSVYGFSGQIRSVQHAVVILGFREVRNMALGLASGQVFGQGGQQQGAELWQHSLGCAAVARSLATYYPGASPDEAFLGGILHDVGKLIFFDVIPDDYASTTADLDPYMIAQVETDSFGITHQEIGQHCADEWELPMELNDVIRFHHDFDEPEVESDLLDVVKAANCLARYWELGSGETQTEETEPTEQLGLKLSEPELQQVRESAEAGYEALCASCG